MMKVNRCSLYTGQLQRLLKTGKSKSDSQPKQLVFVLTILRGTNGDATQIEIVSWMESIFLAIFSLVFIAVEIKRLIVT